MGWGDTDGGGNHAHNIAGDTQGVSTDHTHSFSGQTGAGGGDHTHSVSLRTDSGGDHTHSGTTADNTGDTWRPRYIDLILAEKD
jgi:hypothetical protein